MNDTSEEPTDPLPENQVDLKIETVGRVNFASAQNSVAILRSVTVANSGVNALEGLTLELAAEPAFVKPKAWAIERIAPGETHDIADRVLALDHAMLGGLNEAEHGTLTLRLSQSDIALAESDAPIELLARDEWGGTSEMAQILAAFVSPNDPVIAELMKETGRVLEHGGHAPALDGYQSNDPRRAFMLAAAGWSAMTALGLTYAEPPRSFERTGQKIRDPERVRREGLATCLDTTLMMASLLEGIGLNAAAIFTRGHAFAGVWLVEKTFPSIVEMDITELRKAIAAHEFVAFETTLLTSRPAGSFDQAMQQARARLSEEAEVDFDRAVDIARARSSGIRPMASHRPGEPTEAEPSGTQAVPLPPLPDFGMLPGEIADETPTTPKGRVARWQRKLLDLSLRNRLLNFSDTKSTIPFHCPDVPTLEDRLADGKTMRLISLDDENPIGERDPDVFLSETGQHIHDAFAQEALARGEVCIPLPRNEMFSRLTGLYRKARSDMAEGGTNTLFAAAGFLRWKKTPDDTRTYRAPLLLLPVKLTRRSAQSDFRLSHHEDDVRINATLLQFLQRDFGINVTALEGDLPQDHSGLDLPQIFERMRGVIRDVPGFEIVEDMALSTFSFAKYLMWKDLVDRTDKLRENRLVKHLIDTPERAYSDDVAAMPTADEIDQRYVPADLVTPLPADSSQLATVAAVADGHDIVIIGPPGTGKSQTIANMIAHVLSQGRSILFVAEKSAALDVVHRRLKAYGLGDACLELHSSKTDRRSVLAQLGAAWDRAAKASESEWIRVTDDLRIHRDQLNEYVAALHAQGTHGRSVFDAIGIVAGGQNPTFSLKFTGPDAHDRAAYDGLTDAVREAARTYQVVEGLTGLGSITRKDWSHAWQGELTQAAANLRDVCDDTSQVLVEFQASLRAGKEIDPSIENLEVTTRFAQSVRAVGAEDYQVAISDRLDVLNGRVAELEEAIAKLKNNESSLAARYSRTTIPNIPLASMDTEWREANARMWPFSALARRRIRKLLQSYADGGSADPTIDIPALTAARNQLQTIQETPIAELNQYQGPDTDIDSVGKYLDTATAFRTDLAAFAKVAGDSAEIASRLEPILRAGGNAEEAFSKAEALLQAKSKLDQTLDRYRQLAGGSPVANTLGAISGEMQVVGSSGGRIADWTKWVADRDRAAGLDLQPLLDALHGGTLDPNEAESAFERAYMAWWLPLALDRSVSLRTFAHWEHQDRIQRFRDLDAAAQTLAAEQVVRAVSHDLPARDSVPRKSELGTLRHQLGLQRPSMSIRRLIGEMPTSFSKLAPCVLMSPLSIAQYLPTGHDQFDMVIFDEASQITTWDAIGAIARGRQSVIVGDPKQLPPTNFFGRTTSDDDEDIEEYEKDLPSILDEVTAAGLPNMQLNWHYRSRDETLIAFSNHHYYDDKLVTFPSPTTGDSAVYFHPVEGIYARGTGRTNQVEAEAIVAMIVQRLQADLERPEDERETIGVITFNTQQQEMILDLLDAERRRLPALEWFFDDAREEPVIVKNLESIQGDERDIMCFSITFGKDAAGKMSMAFGAINGSGGEKRLNVAVTRARSELHVFSSITADMIDLKRTSAVGVHHLKNFLDFAERGPEALPSIERDGSTGSDRPFEDTVADALRQRGWDVHTQIGVSGLRIDLGIVHPDRSDTYLAGIECDGTTYYGSRNARDRDRIREEVLRNLGWQILRVWSTDWFTNETAILDRLETALNDCLESSRQNAVNDLQAVSADDGPAEAVSIDTDQDTIGSGEPEADHSADSETPETVVKVETDRSGTDNRDATASEQIDTGSDITKANTGTSAPFSEADDQADAGASEASDITAPESDLPLDADRFFELGYTHVLKTLIARTIAEETPIREDLLTRQIARLHGWQRAGSRIRERVTACMGDAERHDEGDQVFVWQAGTFAAHIPFKGMRDRAPREISQAEIVGLAKAHPDLDASSDPVKDLSVLMGLSRLTEDTRAYLKLCYDAARSNSGQASKSVTDPTD